MLAKIKFLDPSLFLSLYFFFVLTGIGTDLWLVKSVFAEQICFLLAILTSVIRIILTKPQIDRAHWLLAACLCGLLLAPALSSLSNDHMLSILETSKYRQLVKIFAVMFLASPLYSELVVKRLKLSLVLALIYLSVTGLMRYWLMDEFNAETGRMNLNMRHGNANYYATYISALALLAAASWRTKLSGISSIAISRVLISVGVVAAVLGVISSGSRMAMMAWTFCAVLVVLCEALRSRKWRGLLVLCGILALVFSGAWWLGLLARFEDLTDPSSLGRIKGVIAGIQLFAEAPFFGAGFDQTPNHIYNIVGYPMFRDLASPPLSLHNAWFQMLAEMGAFGFVFFVGFWCWVVSRARGLNPGVQKYLNYAVLLCVFLNQQTLPAAYNDAFYAIIFLAGLNTKPPDSIKS